MANVSRFELEPGELRWHCDPDSLGFETTDDFSCRPHIIGQDRALDAIRMGLEMRNPGYNVYISGLTGTGKTTAIRRILHSMDLERENLQDLCYVHNFKLPDAPVCIALRAGKGQALAERLSDALKSLREFIPGTFRSEKFKHKQSRILEDVNKRKNEVTNAFEKEVIGRGFSLVEVDYGGLSRPEIAPVVAGEVVSMDRLPALMLEGKLGRGDFDKMQKGFPELMSRLEEVLNVTRELQAELKMRLRKLEREHILPVVKSILHDIQKQFKDDELKAFLEGLQEFIMHHLILFADGDEEQEPEARRQAFLPFQVNMVVDNAGVTEAPVVIENHPNFVNLFGTIERRLEKEGEHVTDFTGIRAGSLLRANGGFLVLNLHDLFEEPYVWSTLKRTLKTQSQLIRGFDSMFMMPVTSLKPEAIDIDVKVVLIGDDESYHILYEYDEDFAKIFKVKAEFDTVMPKLKKNVRQYCDFIKNMCEGEKLLPFHRTGAAAVIEEGVRVAGRQNKLSTRFSDIGDVIREASYWAARDKARSVRDTHVRRAVEERVRRSNLVEERIQEHIDAGTILLDLVGAKVGQINGLAVYDLGDHRFGKPTRITVETGVGRSGLINIEREAEMSGHTHNKGVLILEGYLRRMYAQDKPITMTASICFEQSYSGVDGDSASSTEIYALLSSLSGLPLRQDIAVTGSVNQKGEVQPIGGVNEKIEGFFDVCNARGLTAHQGVMIPTLNRADLMLRRDVVDAIAKGRFHIYTVRSVDQGIEVLTGVRAGRRLKDGRYQGETVHGLVDDTLRRFLEELRDSENGRDDDGADGHERRRHHHVEHDE
jgi:ATP-dependent Lon protease